MRSGLGLFLSLEWPRWVSPVDATLSPRSQSGATVTVVVVAAERPGSGGMAGGEPTATTGGTGSGVAEGRAAGACGGSTRAGDVAGAGLPVAAGATAGGFGVATTWGAAALELEPALSAELFNELVPELAMEGAAVLCRTGAATGGIILMAGVPACSAVGERAD